MDPCDQTIRPASLLLESPDDNPIDDWACICAELDIAAHANGLLEYDQQRGLFWHLLSCDSCLQAATECINIEEIQRVTLHREQEASPALFLTQCTTTEQ